MTTNEVEVGRREEILRKMGLLPLAENTPANPAEFEGGTQQQPLLWDLVQTY